MVTGLPVLKIWEKTPKLSVRIDWFSAYNTVLSVFVILNVNVKLVSAIAEFALSLAIPWTEIPCEKRIVEKTSAIIVM